MLAETNRYFATLPDSVKDYLLAHMRLVEVQASDTINQLGNKPKFFFPISSVAVTNTVTVEGESFLRFAGSDASVGLAQRLESGVTRYNSHWCSSGYAFSMDLNEFYESAFGSDLDHFRLEFASTTSERALCNNYCSAAHSTQGRLASSLLELSMVNVQSGIIELPQRELASILTSRRETVSMSLSKLSAIGAIETERARIQIMDRELLERESCGCYKSIMAIRERAYRRWEAIPWGRAAQSARSTRGHNRVVLSAW